MSCIARTVHQTELGLGTKGNSVVIYAEKDLTFNLKV